MLRIRDPGSGAFLTPGSWIRDTEWVKIQDPDSGSGTGMNIADHISDSLETSGIFLTLHPGWNNSDPGLTSRIRSTGW